MASGRATAAPRTLLALALLAPVTATRPTVAQQITWVYANQTSLSSAATFLTLAPDVGHEAVEAELRAVLQEVAADGLTAEEIERGRRQVVAVSQQPRSAPGAPAVPRRANIDSAER